MFISNKKFKYYRSLGEKYRVLFTVYKNPKTHKMFTRYVICKLRDGEWFPMDKERKSKLHGNTYGKAYFEINTDFLSKVVNLPTHRVYLMDAQSLEKMG